MSREPEKTMQQAEDPEFDLLGDDITSDLDDSASNHAFRTAPVFTGDAYDVLGPECLPQKALYGRLLGQNGSDKSSRVTSPKMYINTNTPFSALICGVQGSGKSHSTSVLLESALINDRRIGTLPAPLSAIVFHFDTAAGGGLVQPCESAYLSSINHSLQDNLKPPEVIVLVVPNYLSTMRKVYAKLPHVRVEPLLFSPEDISGERLLSMMKVDENTQMPLYMEAIMLILRSMEDSFDYAEFRDQLKQQKFNASQKAMLNLRLSLLDSCMKGGSSTNRASNHFRPGQLTIIDLSSPFMDAGSACGFFDIILGLFIEVDLPCGKLVVLDEAHKYLSESQTGSSARLTDSLLTVIRQQRHLATRVVISTQEPTVVPTKFLDLCSFIIAHRFSSPKWLKALAEHVSAANSSMNELYDKIVSLRTGEAIMFAPNGLIVRDSPTSASAVTQTETGAGPNRTEDSGRASSTRMVAPLGQGYFFVRSRLRVSRDGGHSVLAVNDPATTTRFGRIPAMEEVPESNESTFAGSRSRAASSGGTSVTEVEPSLAPGKWGASGGSNPEHKHFVDTMTEMPRTELPATAEESRARTATALPNNFNFGAGPATTGVPVFGFKPAQSFAPTVQAPFPDPPRALSSPTTLFVPSSVQHSKPSISQADAPVDVQTVFSRLLSESYPIDASLRQVGSNRIVTSSGRGSTIIALEGGTARFAALIHILQTTPLGDYIHLPFMRVRKRFRSLLKERGVPDPKHPSFSTQIQDYVTAAADAGVVVLHGMNPPTRSTLVMLVEGAMYTQNDSRLSNANELPQGVQSSTVVGRPTLTNSPGVGGNTRYAASAPSGAPSSATTVLPGLHTASQPAVTGSSSTIMPSSNAIQLTGLDAQYAPLIKYVQSIRVSGTFPRLTTVVKYFTTTKKAAAHYGRDPAVLNDVVAQAVQRGLVSLTQNQVRLIEGATYLFS